MKKEKKTSEEMFSGAIINYSGSAKYNPDDPSIWYNQPKLEEKINKIKKDFGDPFLITKDGTMLYEHCIVMPCFRDQEGAEYE